MALQQNHQVIMDNQTLDPSRIIKELDMSMTSSPNKKNITQSPEKEQSSSILCRICQRLPILGYSACECTNCQAIFCENCLIKYYPPEKLGQKSNQKCVSCQAVNPPYTKELSPKNMEAFQSAQVFCINEKECGFFSYPGKALIEHEAKCKYHCAICNKMFPLSERESHPLTHLNKEIAKPKSVPPLLIQQEDPKQNVKQPVRLDEARQEATAKIGRSQTYAPSAKYREPDNQYQSHQITPNEPVDQKGELVAGQLQMQQEIPAEWKREEQSVEQLDRDGHREDAEGDIQFDNQIEEEEYVVVSPNIYQEVYESSQFLISNAEKQLQSNDLQLKEINSDITSLKRWTCFSTFLCFIVTSVLVIMYLNLNYKHLQGLMDYAQQFNPSKL